MPQMPIFKQPNTNLDTIQLNPETTTTPPPHNPPLPYDPTSQNFHHTTHTTHNLHNPPISTMPMLICTPYRNPKRRSPLCQRPISTPQMPIFKQPNPKHQSRHHPLIYSEREKEEREKK